MQSGKTKQSSATSKQAPRKQRQQRRPRSTRPKGGKARSIPAAYTSSSSAYASFNKINSTISFQEMFTVDCSQGYFVLPLSPTKWAGTRTRTLVQTYGSFRPLRIQVSYQPSVATSTGGVIAIGTVFNGNRIDLTSDVASNIGAISSLANSFMTQVYQRCSMPLRLGTALSRNNYPTTLIDEDDIPLWIVSQSTVASPGFIIISGLLSVHNPMNVQVSSISGSAVGSIVKPTEEGGETTLQIPAGNLSGGFAVGDTVKFVASKELQSTTGNIIYHALEPVVATVRSKATDVIKFAVNSALAATTARFFPIGQASSANFI